MTGFRPTVAVVDLGAVRHNVRAMAPAGAELMAVVKGDGYGHGAVEVARASLEAGATRLGVALVEEGLGLRDAGVRAPILVLSEFPPGSEKEALTAGLVPSLYTGEGLAGLAEAAAAVGRPVGVHVKIDTGMHRVGLHPPDGAVGFVSRVLESGLALDGVWTHFPTAESDPVATREQLRTFLAAVDELGRDGAAPSCVHAANSAAALLLPESHLDMVRAGIAIYGLDPTHGRVADLRPALSWRSAVSMVKRLPAREAVSYGGRYRLERDSTIATVPVGYADGYDRGLSSRADVLIGGRRHPVAGAVTMDHILVDCGDANVRPGDEVVLLGPQANEEVTAGELAGLLDTIHYEVVTRIAGRVPREYRG